MSDFILRKELGGIFMSKLKNNTKILAVGRTNAGKDTVSRELASKYGLTVLSSYTDKEKRADQTNGVEHIFLTKEEMDNLLETEEIVAYTEAVGGRYCATRKQVEDCDIYIIDPEGIKYMKEKYSSKFNFLVIYIAATLETRKQRSELRGDDKSKFEERCGKENNQFDEFEKNKGYDLCFVNECKYQSISEDIGNILEGMGLL